MSIDLSIIVVSFNTIDVTRRCLDSLRAAAFAFSYEVIVVDNASQDGSADMVAREFPDVRLIRNAENRMYAKANNQGIRAARGTHFLLLNSDTRVLPGQIEILLDFIISHQPRVACVGPRILRPDGSVQVESYPIDGFWPLFAMLLGVPYWPIPKSWKLALLPAGTQRGLMGQVRRTGYVSGCALLTTRAATERVGLLDEALFFYGEEVDYCLRLKKAGYETWCVPGASVIHEHGASTKGPIVETIRAERARSRRYFVLKHYSRTYRYALGATKLVLYVPLAMLATILRLPIRRTFRLQIEAVSRELRALARPPETA